MQVFPRAILSHIEENISIFLYGHFQLTLNCTKAICFLPRIFKWVFEHDVIAPHPNIVYPSTKFLSTQHLNAWEFLSLHHSIEVAYRGSFKFKVFRTSYSNQPFPTATIMSLSNKLAITDVDLKDKRVLIRVRSESFKRYLLAIVDRPTELE